ncbi:MAG TPA: formimidoylglutamate deiminase [Acidimicrobiales bacterium]|nr:formimidoylglutamate deiminase [Acidimicrobiales bacterium]
MTAATGATGATIWYAPWAWLGGDEPAAVPGVVLEVDGGVIAGLRPGAGGPPAGAVVLPGLAMPGLVNAHSHAFHRALRGRAGGGDFWAWRDGMYALASRLDPESYLSLATACFAEMAETGITTVHEFHYLHQPRGMDDAVVEAARAVGLRLVLLDTCYLRAGFGEEPLSPVQRRFSDGDVHAWAARASALAARYPDVSVGAAVHSVRAVDAVSMRVVGAWAEQRGAPMHLHLSEQQAENGACLAATGRTPTELVAGAGLLGPRTTVVHATHVTAGDMALLGDAGVTACLCPTTERDLADGVGPAAALRDAGCTLALGSDSHAVIDLFEEARAVELDERLVSGRRGVHVPAALLNAAAGGNRLAVGEPADFIAVSLDSVRMAGFGAASAADHVVFATSAADVTDVVVGGRRIVAGGRHVTVDTPAALAASIGSLVRP